MRVLFLLSLFGVSMLLADCKAYFTLGDKVSKGLENLPKIVWHQKGNSFTLDPIGCQQYGFVLLHDNTKEYTQAFHTKSSYTFERGWNFVAAPQNGVDVLKTFGSSSSILFVYVYDHKTPAWAGYSPQKSLQKMMQTTRILHLTSIEPSRGFYVYANKKTSVEIVSTQRPKPCQEILESGAYNILTDSDLKSQKTQDLLGGITLATLYRSHYRRGVYSDTRVELLYPKDLKPEQGKDSLRYAPIEPRAKIEYAKEYQEQKFYVVDYFTKECYEGIFPSKRIPPYPVLKKLR